MDYLQKKTFIPFLVGSTPIFGPSTLEKGTTKLSLSRSVGRYARRVIINLLKKDSQTFSEILHEARESQESKAHRVNLFLFYERKFLVSLKMTKISPKARFLGILQTINAFMFLFYPKIVPKRVLCDSPKSTCLEKIWFSNAFSQSECSIF